MILCVAAGILHAQDLHIVTTGDVHGCYFNRAYVGEKTNTSLMSVKHYVDSLRDAAGEQNVLLLDAGDCLQGDNASYFYNYVVPERPHIFPRLAAYMGYDACTVGNHDIEAGHPVYDRVYKELKDAGIPWLAGNAIKDDGTTYFPEYTVIEKGGRKILVAGYNNANIDGWLSPELWEGMKHISLVPYVRKRVKALKRQIKPDAVVVVVHSGTGDGNFSSIESQGLDIFRYLCGADVLVTAHDHRPAVVVTKQRCLVNGGARCGAVGHAVLGFKNGRVVSRNAEVVRLNKYAVDEQMVKAFDAEYQEVKAFTMRPVGKLAMPLRSRDAYVGMSDYLGLLHTVQLTASGADVSIAAPLTFNGYVAPGAVIFNDMFTIYPFENQMFVLKLTGREIKDLLEYSYDKWITTPGEHVLQIANAPDPRTGASVVSRKGAGTVSFGTLSLGKQDIGKTYRYTIHEVKGTAQYFTYDVSVYTVTVAVTDSGDGEPKATVTITDENQKSVDRAVFTNTYAPPEKPEIPKTGQLWWPVVVLAFFGLLLIILGVGRRRAVRED